MKKKFYVTTPVYYPNDKLHIGHAYTTTLADYITRYKKMQGFETMFITGSDEHGQKIQEKATELGKSPKEFVDKIIESFKDLWLCLGIENDIFIRTTDKIHKDYVKNSFTNLMNDNFIYKSQYTGLYCKSDESFYTETQLNNGKCPDCGRKVTEVSEESYFLKISEFKDWVKDILKNTNILEPKHRVNELINNFVEELKDLSITRTSFDWGIKISEDSSHVIYVWLDALQNYITSLLYPKSKFTIEEVWGKDSDVEILQLVGKEITRFHCIYWPIILKMKGYRNPSILAHGWIVTDTGEKMSKWKGNVIDPIKLIETYGRDSLRFYLINNIVTGEDGKFSNELFEGMINGLLVNKYSNLVARTDTMIKKYFKGIVPPKKKTIKEYEDSKYLFESYKNKYIECMDKYDFSNSLKELIKYVEKINGLIDKTEPWKKEGGELESIINFLVNEIYNVTTLLSPVLIDSCKKVYDWLGEKNQPSFERLGKDFSGSTLSKIDFLFKRF